MKRPLLVIGITLLGVYLISGLFSGSIFPICLQGLFALGLVISLINKRARQNLILPTVFAVGFVACLAFLVTENGYYKTLTYCGDYHTVEAVVCEYPEFRHEYGRNYCIAEIKSLDGEKVKGKIRLSYNEAKDEIDGDTLVPGNKITFRGYVYKIGQSIPGITRYFKSQRVYVGAYWLRDLTVTESKIRPFSYYTKAVNRYISKTLTHDFGAEVGGFMLSLLTGERDFLSDNTYDNFKVSGAAHIMAISGFNLSIAAVFLKFILDKIKTIPRILRNLIIALSVFAIMAVADFSGSVKRAGIMMLMYLLADTLSENSDPLNNLGFSAVVLLLSPYGAYDSSFLLSFACTWAILSIGLPVCDILNSRFFSKLSDSLTKRFIKASSESIVFSLSILFCTGTLGVLLFGSIAYVSPLTNLLLLPAIPFAMGFCILHLLFGGIPLVGELTGFLAKTVAKYILYVVDTVAAWQYGNIAIEGTAAIHTAALVFALITLGMYFLVNRLEKKHKKYHSAL